MIEVLNLTRMARRLGVSPIWLREQADAKLVPAIKAGKTFLFNPDAVRDALSRQATPSNSEVSQ